MIEQTLAREDLLDHYRMLVDLWAPRLRIAERVSVVVVDVIEASDGEGSDTECTMYPAQLVPESAGLWDFELAVSGLHQPEDPERAVVHELVHLILEPLRGAYFEGGVVATGNGSRDQDVQRWETVVERLADLILRRQEQAGP